MSKLYIVPTPIGNLDDITLRAVRVLREVDLILAEDTRTSSVLLRHLGIEKRLHAHHKFNEHATAAVVAETIAAGRTVALISDAGTPGISDPGEDLVRICYEQGIEVTSLPGAAACITALTLSGLPTRRFSFEAFLPKEKKERAAVLEELKNDTRTLIVYEAPHHLLGTLKELQNALGNRRLTVCRELTKKFETAFQTTFSEAIRYYEEQGVRGECVLVIEGRSREELVQEAQQSWEAISVEEHMEHYLSTGMDRKSAMKQVAKDRGVGKREIYQMLLKAENE